MAKNQPSNNKGCPHFPTPTGGTAEVQKCDEETCRRVAVLPPRAATYTNQNHSANKYLTWTCHHIVFPFFSPPHQCHLPLLHAGPPIKLGVEGAPLQMPFKAGLRASIDTQFGSAIPPTPSSQYLTESSRSLWGRTALGVSREIRKSGAADGTQ